MSAFMTTLVVSGTVLLVILGGDLGRRKVNTMRLVRPLVAVAVVMVLFFHSPQLSGNDLSLQLVGIGLGTIFGLAAGAMLPAERDPSGQVYTRAGVLYALFWLAMSGARVLFVYGIEHWYTAAIITFSVKYRISGPEVFSNALVLMALATVLARTVVVMNRRRRLRAAVV
ncbi:hypothetical protein ACIGXM_22550 [Kitasatospora sp. NPDC052896]|uniref:hypothetical protein n=1 Tax=Kitasatospora sp. NPDC052896 TaxID=3364061 RepID=UPI0037CB22E7